MSYLALALVLPAAAIALVNWRKGLYAFLVVGFLQDPARKLEVDQPVYFTLLAGVVLAAAFLRAQRPRVLSPARVGGWDRYLRVPSVLLLLLLVVQGAVSVARYGNPVIAGIGAISYFAPLPAMLLGYQYALRAGRQGIERWLAWYVLGALIVLPGILLEFAGVEWRTLGHVGSGFEMYISDAILTAHSGFFRAAETAAWHTATAVCLLLLLSSVRRLSTSQIVVAVMLMVALLAIGALTGRRKLFVEVVIFVSAYASLLLLFGKGGLRLAMGVFLGGLVAYGGVIWWAGEQPYEVAAQSAVSYRFYTDRSATVTSDVLDRFLELGLQPIEWAIGGFGWLGGGLGVASQGAQHFGGGGEVFGGAGEGGLGKVTAELGVPGLVVVAWFAVSAVRLGWKVLVFVSERSAGLARLAYGLVALLTANLAVFLVATQVFGDVFLLLVLGLVSGFFLATPVLAERERAGHAPAAVPSNRPRYGHAVPVRERQ